jgi:signal transduction histidine kinase
MRQLLKSWARPGTGHDSALWPVLLLFLIVLVPSAGVVWMMRAAMDNERLAVRQKLGDAYRVQLEIAHRRIEQQWQEILNRLDAIVDDLPPAQAFVRCVTSGPVDGVVILGADDDSVVYPDSAEAVSISTELAGARRHAEDLEFAADDPLGAARAYRQIAKDAEDLFVAARAEQAQARVLARAGDSEGALRILQKLRLNDVVTDENGRSLAADAELRLLDLLPRDSAEWTEVAQALANRLNNYEALPPAADQRRFLMHALHALEPTIEFKTLAAEDLAAEFAASSTRDGRPGVFAPTKVPELLQVRSTSGRVIALVLRPRLKQELERQLAEQPFPEGVATAVREAGQDSAGSEELAAVSLAPLLPGMRMVAEVDDAKSFDAAADKRLAYLLATGVVVVGITAALALLVGGVLRRQWRLTRLKNDLVATVSHELKTPLASIRLLVDTLLDEDGASTSGSRDPVRTREYLEMISKENSRLSRLIDNFLTFSRMERGKHRFNFEPIDAANVVDQAVAAVAERFDGTQNTLSVRVQRPLEIIGDADALVTVVVNLLDNAWKYSDSPRQIDVEATRESPWIAISVSDTGIGLSPKSVGRIFDRFYQVDQYLSRSHDGCGLGLSIVKYIVEAHGGRVAVESTLGAGSKFTVSLPADVATSNRVEKLAQAQS